MNPKLDERYLAWLYAKVEIAGMSSYWTLMEQLFRTEFQWHVPNDDSRASDGKELRREFVFHHRMRNVPEDWATLECSMLEMLIGVANRMAFQMDQGIEECFWHILANIGLDESTDENPLDPGAIAHILTTIVWRTYEYDGVGGLFPLKYPSRDQRNVEILYQLYSYIIENN